MYIEIENIPVPSDSGNYSYIVSVWENRQKQKHYQCSCAGYKFNGHCKHIARVTEQRAAIIYAEPSLQFIQENIVRLQGYLQRLKVTQWGEAKKLLEISGELYKVTREIRELVKQGKGQYENTKENSGTEPSLQMEEPEGISIEGTATLLQEQSQTIRG